MDRILVVEDDLKVQRALQRLFEPEGFTVELASDGQAGVEAFQADPPKLVVLDLNLPKMVGRDVCQEMKRLNAPVPIIILSAASDVVDKVLLLELGADDYVTKPFSPRELLARVRVVLRRGARGTPSGSFSFQEVAVNFEKMEVTRSGGPIQLTAQEFKILKYMIENSEKVLTREQLLNEVWGYQNYPTTRTVDNHILNLRQKLEADPSNPVHFRTVHGVGYKFIP
jgi:DNA-binding response OmpR family regulator